MTILGLIPEANRQQGGEVRIDLQHSTVSKVIRLLGNLIPGAAVALVLACFELLRDQPKEGFDLLRQWGAWWVVSLAGGYWVWSLGMRAVDYLGKLAGGVQDSAVAISRLADRDDRERDRMITETSYIGQQMTKIADHMAEMRQQSDRIERALKVSVAKGE